MSDSATWPERYAATALGWETSPDELVGNVCRRLPPGRALLLCAGEGRNALWLAGRRWTVTAVDSSQVRVGRILSRAALMGVSVDALMADVLSYHPPPGADDLVLLAYPELSSARLRLLLGVAAAALRPGGRLVIVGRDASNLDNGYGGPDDPDLLTTPETLSRWVTALGLDVRRADVVRREVVVDVGVRHVQDHIVEAVRPAST